MNLTQFSKNNAFLMLAIDHQGTFKKMINPQDPSLVSDVEVIELKSQIINSLKDEFTGVLLDCKYGLPAFKGVDKPYLMRVEKSGYEVVNGIRTMELEYTASELKEKGASGIKLLLHVNPFASGIVEELNKAKKAIEDAHSINFPMFLEILTYVNDAVEIDKGSLIIKSIQLFQDNGIIPDVWKLEYPGSDQYCFKITELVKPTPWIVLSGGVNYEEFVNQLESAVSGGAKGFLAGRAIWKDVTNFQGDERVNFLKNDLKNRFIHLNSIAIDS